MSLPTLPVELIDNILQNVQAPDLAALALTCISLSPVAQRLLYRDITVSAWSHNTKVVATLAKRPDLAIFVRSFSITTTTQPLVFAAFHRLLATALSSMTELTALSLNLADSSTSWILEKAAQFSYNRLHQFTASFPLDQNVVNFLEKTPNLIELEVDSIRCPEPASPVATLLSTTIPHLAQFVGSVRAAKMIVPGRPLESIHLSEGDLVYEDVADFSRATGRVLVFSATASTPPVPLLESVAHCLPHLAYLRIMTTYQFTQAPKPGFMDQVANALATLPDLTAFELSGMQWGSSKREDDSSKRVWQSAPLTTAFIRPDDAIIDAEEVFLQY
ncbi:hypothetical protein HWV62_7848 [Athelia sp. TMB]|nr:hypothetical protein HWV62_7848 [Athelia sp. TMB]